MVENKHSINTILSFGAKSVNPKILEQLLTGRADIADFFEKKIRAIVEEKTNQFWLIVGQRGMGKTHLLKVLHSRVWHYVEENKLVIAYFAEEEYGVANFFDFLLRILNSFIKWYDKDSEFLKSELEKLQNLPSNKQSQYLENIIKDYIKEKPMLILTENFGDILEQMGENEQGRLRAWLYENNRVSIIATSQSVSDNFEKEDRPFFGFFTTYILKNLTFEESLSFLISLAELDKDEKLIEHLNGKGKAQVRAIYDLVKGNHRLLVTFYQFLKTDTVAKVSENFIKTINDLKPYYETYIRYLPPQQQKILRYIALARKPQKGVEISKNCFIEQKSLSKQLSELTKKNLLDANEDPSDKRNKFYDVSEPLLRISIEVGEHKEGITALFIDFLALYYNAQELMDRVARMRKLFIECNNEKDKKNYDYEIQAIRKAIEQKIEYLQIDLPYNISKLIKKEKFDEIIELIDEHNKKEKLLFVDKNLILLPIANLVYDRKGSINSYKYYSQISIDFVTIKNNENFSNALLIPYNQFVYRYSSAYMEYGDKNNQIETFKKGIKALETIKKEEVKFNLLYIFYSIDLLDKEIELEKKHENLSKKYLQLFNDLKKVKSEEKPDKEMHYAIYMLIINSLESNNTEITLIDEVKSEFINLINKNTKNNKIELLNSLMEIGEFWLFAEFQNFIENNIINFKDNLINFLNNLMVDNTLKTTEIELLQKFVENNKSKIPELEMSKIYLDIYKEYYIKENKSILFELPKEQREFFEKNILKKKK